MTTHPLPILDIISCIAWWGEGLYAVQDERKKKNGSVGIKDYSFWEAFYVFGKLSTALSNTIISFPQHSSALSLFLISFPVCPIFFNFLLQPRGPIHKEIQ